MAYLITNPKFSAWTSAGIPGSGYKLYTYEAGTTTPKATYTNPGGGTPNANPVVLDSRGEADVYLSGSGYYKFVLCDPADVVVWTVDDVGEGTISAAFAQEHDSATGQHVFPGTRAAGDVFYDDGTNLVRAALGAEGYVLSAGASAPAWALPRGINGIQVYTSGSGNWTIPAGVTRCLVRLWGGGGGGGGSDTNGRYAGGGGGGGGYAEKLITGLTPGTTKAYAVGAGGTTAGASVGGNGGTSSFGGVVSATGGGGGGVGTLATCGAGGAGGGHSGADFGMGGARGSRPNGDATSGYPGGHGGAAGCGGGGGPHYWASDGESGATPGGGGAGASAGRGASTGTGGAGLIVIYY